MKKVKIMLLAVTVLAAAGGALAFKAKKGAQLFCGTQQNVCTTFYDLTYTTAQGEPLPGVFCSTTSITDNCPIRVEIDN